MIQKSLSKSDAEMQSAVEIGRAHV
jgi:hypothetical protein